MSSKLVRFKDGVEVEVVAQPNEAKPISSSNAEHLDKNFAVVQATLERICAPFKNTFSALATAAGEVQFTKAEVELALSFTAEGNLFVTKAKGEAGLTVKLTLERGGSNA